ncbi:GGDEF domain-containing protein [Clostridium sp. LY3-2]|uniref:tetratricopeptide repeat-containing diguanylate cyclase n=1 Tax=Clostridium sp. LY3-2 TaxID=2942482 RepID=UPI0021538E66|nr:GGDEF domain-containing protein [Clostridium sp. LY3-2]MCR6514068.1 GGDEF domain-containing protein [Clostridium sp. LY3-2]
MLKETKTRNIKIFIYGISIILMIIFIFSIFQKEKGRVYTTRFINLVKEEKVFKLEKNDLKSFKEQILIEKGNSKKAKNTKLSNYSLGVIEYLNENYEKSIEFLKISEGYSLESDKELEFDILVKLAMNYTYIGDLRESNKYIKKAEELGRSNGLGNEVSDAYYELVSKRIDLDYNVKDCIELLENSLNLIQDHKRVMKSYLLLATLNRLRGDYNQALIYDQRAIGIALDSKNDEYLGKCLISLSENYYTKRQYRKAINLLQTIIDGNMVKDPEDKLKLYGYLIDCNLKTGNLEKGEEYKEKFLETVNSLNPNARVREVMWLHVLYSDSNLLVGNFEVSDNHLKMAKKLYSKNNNKVHINTKLLLDKLEIKRQYTKDKDYKKAIKKYENIIDEIKKKESGFNLYYDLVWEISTLSYLNKDNEYLYKYSKEIYEIYNEVNITVDTDSVIADLNTYVEKREAYIDKYKIYGLIILLILAIAVVFTIYNINVKISKSNKKLERDNITDGLTGAYNKRYLNQILEKNIGKNIVFVMLDIDFFKSYNDNYGHMQGDEALITVSNLLRDVFKEDLVFRYGGEEFSIISERNFDFVIRDLEIFNKRLHEKNIVHEFSSISDRITLSMGISKGCITSFEEGENLIKESDRKLYESKSTGRNKISF